MPSPFVEQLIKPLDIPKPVLTTNGDDPRTRELQALLVSLQRPLSRDLAQDAIESLTQVERRRDSQSRPGSDVLTEAIIAKILVGLYAESLDLCLSQAANADTESEWWAEIQRSRLNLAWYLLQTMPTRFLNLTRMVLHTLYSQNLPIRLETFSLALFRRIYRSLDSRPNPIIAVLFPHLRYQGISITSSTISSSRTSTSPMAPRGTLLARMWAILDPFISLANFPIALIRQECIFKRKELEKVRDQKAEVLGRLSQMRRDLSLSITKPWNMKIFIEAMSAILEGDASRSFSPLCSSDAPSRTPLNELEQLSVTVYSTQKVSHQNFLDSRELLRPSRLTLIWPKLVLLPPLCIYSLRSAYALRETLVVLVSDAKATVEGFVRGWLLEPIKEALRTVRTGGEDGIIIQKEGIEADFASLERMTLALAQDQLNYSSEQLAYLSSRIHVGDLTPVQQIYEEDIKRPLKSAVTGTLLRSVFIQVQKAKVDIDQALAGIDKLLKSQELTFAFVGVAPALSIVYLLGGSLITLWTGGSRKNKYGSRRRIFGAWSAIRRTERLLITQPTMRGHKIDRLVEDPYSISPLTSGLMLLSVARLRTYAETCLPPRSRLRESFLEDVVDLENPDLGRVDKIRIVDRMWRCWSDTLGWGRITAGSNSRV